MWDPGCTSVVDTSELDEELGECANALDDDGNGLADFPHDPHCEGRGDLLERPSEIVPSCSNGLDDDGDSLIDFPLDPGCSGRGDPEEDLPGEPPECVNEEDDDGDGQVDFPDDYGCVSASDPSESNACELIANATPLTLAAGLTTTVNIPAMGLTNELDLVCSNLQVPEAYRPTGRCP